MLRAFDVLSVKTVEFYSKQIKSTQTVLTSDKNSHFAVFAAKLLKKFEGTAECRLTKFNIDVRACVRAHCAHIRVCVMNSTSTTLL
jgi:hypothetical protein